MSFHPKGSRDGDTRGRGRGRGGRGGTGGRGGGFSRGSGWPSSSQSSSSIWPSSTGDNSAASISSTRTWGAPPSSTVRGNSWGSWDNKEGLNAKEESDASDEKALTEKYAALGASGWRTSGCGWGDNKGGWGTPSGGEGATTGGWGEPTSGWGERKPIESNGKGKEPEKNGGLAYSKSGWEEVTGQKAGSTTTGRSADTSRKVETSSGWGASGGGWGKGSETSTGEGWGESKGQSGSETNNSTRGTWGKAPVAPSVAHTKTPATIMPERKIPPTTRPFIPPPQPTSSSQAAADSKRTDSPIPRSSIMSPSGHSRQSSVSIADTAVARTHAIERATRSRDESSDRRARPYSPFGASLLASFPPLGAPVGDDDVKKGDEQHRKMIDLFARSVLFRSELQKAEEKLDQWKRTQNSESYAHIGPAGRQILDEERAKLDEIVKFYRAQSAECLQQIVKISDESKDEIQVTASVNIAPLAKDLDEIERYIAYLKPCVDNLMESKRPTPAEAALAQQDDSLEEGQIPTSILGKRRWSPSTEPSGPPALPPLIHPAESLRRNLKKLKARMDELEDWVSSQTEDKDILEEARRRLKKKYDELRATAEEDANNRMRKLKEMAESTQQSRIKIDEMQQRVEGLKKTVEWLIARKAYRERRMDELEASQAEENRKIAEYEAMIQRSRIEYEKLLAQRDTLVTQVQEIVARRARAEAAPAPAPNPEYPPELRAKFRTYLDERVDEVIARDVLPLLDEMKDRTEEQVKAHYAQIYQHVWEKMLPAMKITEGFTRWSNSTSAGASDGAAPGPSEQQP